MKVLSVQKHPDDTDIKVLKGIKHGLTIKEVAYESGLKEYCVRDRLKVMRTYYRCKNTTQLIDELRDRGIL